MATPEFILELREKIGHDLLWIPGVTGVVLDQAAQRVLLVQRSDNRRWALVTGLLDPGEEPAQGIVREILEETGVHAVAERVLALQATVPTTFGNGDRIQTLDVAFVCRAVGGEARVNDDESIDVRWFGLDELPELPERHVVCVGRALEEKERTWFVSSEPEEERRTEERGGT